MTPNGLRSRLPRPKIAGREEIRRPRRRWEADGGGFLGRPTARAGSEASDERDVARLAGVEGGVIARAAGVTQKGIVPLSPTRYRKLIPSTDSMGYT